jgi:hypothetical protein
MNVRPFAYNPDGNILGTQQVGSLSIGTPTAGFTAYPSIKFWNGPTEYPGAIIVCYPDLEGGHTGADGATAYIGFKMFTNPVAFMIFVEQELGTTPTDPEHAKALLNNAGVWTNYGEESAPGGASGTNSGVTLTIQESGANVVWSYSGSLDLSNLTLGGTQTISAGFSVGSAIWAVGLTSPVTVDSYSSNAFVTFPANFGDNGGGPASSGTGDTLSVLGGDLGRTLLVPNGYVSNTLISGSTTYLNGTLSSLGLTEGTYTYSWGSGTNESITVLIGGTPSGTDGTSGNSGSGLGEWSFYSDEGPINAMPPNGNGQLMINGNTNNGTAETYDPNYNQDDEVIWNKYILLSLSNSAGVSRETEFTELMNNGGRISLTQNGQTATYFFNGQGPFFVDPNGWFVIPISIQSARTDEPFVFGDPITVSIP